MKLMIGILFMSLVMFVVAIADAAVLTTSTLLFTTRRKLLDVSQETPY